VNDVTLTETNIYPEKFSRSFKDVGPAAQRMRECKKNSKNVKSAGIAYLMQTLDCQSQFFVSQTSHIVRWNDLTK